MNEIVLVSGSIDLEFYEESVGKHGIEDRTPYISIISHVIPSDRDD
jgi:hypothetical protein